MLRSFFTQHIAIEVDKELKHLKYGIQLLTDESDLLFLSKNLLETAKRQVQIEVIIISHTESKSIKITNLMKRLVDSGVEVYWHYKERNKESVSLFAILDKSYVISTESDTAYDSKELLVRSKVDDFNQIMNAASPIQLYTGDIVVNYVVDKTIVYKGEKALLNWDVKNAHTLSIVPDLGEVPLKGSELIEVNKNVKYQLTAKNSNSEIQRTIFIKVISSSVINFMIEVYDPILEDYMQLQSMNPDILKFGVYLNQKVRINWEIETEGKLVEQSLGALSLHGSHEFFSENNAHFSFEFTSHDKKMTTNIHFFTFEDVSKLHQDLDDTITSTESGLFSRVFKNIWDKLSKSN